MRESLSMKYDPEPLEPTLEPYLEPDLNEVYEGDYDVNNNGCEGDPE